MKLDQPIVDAYVNTFFGYGNPQARWWFVGMEEYGCCYFDEAKKRIRAWDKLGQKPLVDLRTFDKEAKLNVPHLQNPPNFRSSRTWNRQIRVLLSAQGLQCDEQHIAGAFAEWGNEKGQTCIIDLKPLPCRSYGEWLWPQWCNIENTKQRFVDRVEKERCRKIVEMLTAGPVPRCVCFFGTGFQRYWEQIAGCEMKTEIKPGIRGIVTGKTVFVMIPQRASRGVSIAYNVMKEVGEWIKSQGASCRQNIA